MRTISAGPLPPLVTVLALALLGSGCSGPAGGGGGGGGDPDGGLDPDGSTGCLSGTQDADDDGVCEPDCASTECVHGTCEESTTSGLAECTCDAGFEGGVCNDLVVPSAAGVALWLDAADDASFAYHSGQAVSTWTERSAAALEATSVDADVAPTRVAAALNGRPVVRFDGVDDELVMTGVDAFSEATDGDYTLFLVVRTTTEGSGDIFYAEGDDDELEVVAYDTVSDGTPGLEFNHSPGGGFDTEVTAQGSSYGDPGWTHAEYHLVTIQRSHESLVIWVDGNNQTSTFDHFGNDFDQTLDDLLTLTFSPWNSPLAMDLAEMIVVSDDLHYGERLPYEEYLAAKWFGAAFASTPTAFGEAIIWLDAQDAEGVTQANGDVTSWANRGIDGGYFANGTFADSRPTYVAEGFGGRPVVRFDGGDALGQNYISINDGAVQSEYAMILVIDPPGTGSRQLAFRADRDSDEATIFQLDLLPDVSSFEFLHRIPPDAGEVWAPEADLDAPRIVIIERSTAGTFTIRIGDSTEVFNGDADADFLGANTNWVLGGASIADPGDGLVGDIAELIVLSNRLLAAEEEGLVELLRAKWGL
jgi:hypothetical protein